MSAVAVLAVVLAGQQAAAETQQSVPFRCRQDRIAKCRANPFGGAEHCIRTVANCRQYRWCQPPRSKAPHDHLWREF